MGSSRGFASTATDLIALFRLGFPSASAAETLNLAVTVSRRIIMQKARRHTLPVRAIVLRPLVGIWFQVHYPPLVRGSSHLSLALLSSLSVAREYLALRDGPRRFRSGFHVSRPTQVPLERLSACRLRDCHPLWSDFPDRSASRLAL